MNFERHRRGGRRITERGRLEERHVETEMRLLQRGATSNRTFCDEEGGGVKILKRGKKRLEERKIPRGKQLGKRTKRKGGGEGRSRQVDGKKAAKHFFLLKFARASRAKRVFHPEPLSFLAPLFPLFFNISVPCLPRSSLPFLYSFVKQFSLLLPHSKRVLWE